MVSSIIYSTGLNSEATITLADLFRFIVYCPIFTAFDSVFGIHMLVENEMAKI